MIMSTFGYCREKGEDPGQNVGASQHRQGEPEPSLLLFVDIAELVLQFLLDLHDPLRVVQKAFALVGQKKTVTHALEQRDADALFQIADKTAEGRLGDVKGFGGGSDAVVLSHRGHILHILVADLHTAWIHDNFSDHNIMLLFLFVLCI